MTQPLVFLTQLRPCLHLDGLDGLISSTATQVVIHVLAVNDHSPVFVRPLQPVVLNISESVEPGTVVVTVKAEDLDGDLIQYFFGSGGNPNGALIRPVNLDAEDKSVRLSPLSLVLLVEAKDNLVHTTLLDITVNFQYVNEFAPEFEATTTAGVFENATLGQRIAEVTATDKDSGPDGTLSYSLLTSDVPTNMFKINPDTGLIALACSNCLDFNEKNFYTLVIKVEDGNYSILIIRKTICIYN
ncbi:protocadherin [Elysia marginata]|uniref:Protocadherin n=1 Tax=Elysia marginata TaxID=1093978 RepID=A0AAV4ICH8_9GAST|nr:protocadherin [Elysia marginata]